MDCLGAEAFDGEGTGEANRAIDACLAEASGAGDPEGKPLAEALVEIGADGWGCVEGPSPFSGAGDEAMLVTARIYHPKKPRQ